MLIEYDGMQHFKKSNFFNLSYTSYNDSIKNKFAKENDIDLLRIPYTEYNNIENIIMERIYASTDTTT